MSSLAVVLNFCPVYCPYCAQRLRIVDDQQRRMDFFNTGVAETCLTCGAGFRFGPYLCQADRENGQGLDSKPSLPLRERDGERG